MNALGPEQLNGTLQASQRRPVGSCVCENRQGVNKQQVASGFDKAASRYNTLAKVQEDIANYGLTILENMHINKAHCVVDIGCGTAKAYKRLANIALPEHHVKQKLPCQHTHQVDHLNQQDSEVLRAPVKQVLGLDISMNMLRHAVKQTAVELAEQAAQIAIRQQATFTAINGDAESLPFTSGSVDVVFSSMALQWCESPVNALAEINRILKPGAKALLCILTGESFNELHQAWQHIGLPSRVNKFHSKQVWLNAAHDSRTQFVYEDKCFTSHHRTVVDMLSSIKLIGANTRIGELGAVTHYISKQEIRRLTNYISNSVNTEVGNEKNTVLNNDKLMPLTYQMLFLDIKKADVDTGSF